MHVPRCLLVFTTVLFLFSLQDICPAQSRITADPKEYIIQYIDSLNGEARHWNTINIDLLKNYADRALNLSSRIHYEKGIACATNTLAMFESGQENYYQALDLLYQYLDFVKKTGDISEEESVSVRIAMLYLTIGNYEFSLLYCKKVEELSVQSRKPYDIAQAYHCFATYYYHTDSIPLALAKADSALRYANLAGDIEQEARIEKLLGDLYIEKDLLSTSIHYYNEALQDFELIKDSKEPAIILTRLGHIYELEGNYTEALNLSHKALVLRLSQDNKKLLSNAEVNLGNAYLNVGHFDSAFSYYQKGLQTAYKSENIHAVEYALKQLYEFYKKKRTYITALQYGELYLKAHDQANLEKTSSSLNEFELKYQEKEQQDQIRLLQKENEIQRLTLENRSYSELLTQLIIGIIGILLILIVYIIERNKLGRSKLETINRQLHQEIDERKLKEIQLCTSEELYRFITDHTPDLIVRMDRKFHYLFVSPSVLRMFGYNPEDPSAFPPLREFIPAKFQKELWMQYVEMIRTKKPVMLTHQSQRKNGSLFWSESLINPIFDPETGKLKETITVIRDISDRVVYEESLSENARQKELLLREIHHRVKNNFAILVSLMNMQKMSSAPGDFKDFLTELQGRIRTMSLVHELLYRSQDIDYIHFGEYLGQLVSIISRAYSNKTVKVHSSIETCILDVETALPLGLISNEILTNAFKYAFEDNQEGKLWIDLQRCPAAADPDELYTHTLTIRDNGRGLPDGFSMEGRSSMGSQIITLLVDQLEGELEINGQDGASFTIYFSDEKRS
ncbi:MAG: PAS domain S-box protein [Bacteroidetes bacterium]|nr:MAG: PAS domain S-box protein [Bacteroidota bacterium]